MFLVSSCSCLCLVHLSQVLSREWRCTWSRTDRRCSIYIGVINNFIAYHGMTCIRGLTVFPLKVPFVLLFEGGFSASYTAVLTWLLSLVPDSLSVLTSPCDNVAVPFYVLGLQQLFLEGQLMLYVTVCPVDRFTAKDMPNKRKMRVRDANCHWYH